MWKIIINQIFLLKGDVRFAGVQDDENRIIAVIKE